MFRKRRNKIDILKKNEKKEDLITFKKLITVNNKMASVVLGAALNQTSAGSRTRRQRIRLVFRRISVPYLILFRIGLLPPQYSYHLIIKSESRWRRERREERSTWKERSYLCVRAWWSSGLGYYLSLRSHSLTETTVSN